MASLCVATPCNTSDITAVAGTSKDQEEPEQATDWEAAWQALLVAFAGSSFYTLMASWLPVVRTFPVATWVGMAEVTAWGWEVTPSMGYIGQGMIMGPKTAFSMLAGAVAGMVDCMFS